MQPPLVLLDAVFRVGQDATFRESLAAARAHHLPHSEFLAWEPSDREKVFALQDYEDECCNDCGVHPRVWKRELGGHPQAVSVGWRFCRVCELIAQANRAGPPGERDDGYHLTLKINRELRGGSSARTGN